LVVTAELRKDQAFAYDEMKCFLNHQQFYCRYIHHDRISIAENYKCWISCISYFR